MKIDRDGLMLLYKHVLGKEWIWVDIVKPPQVKSLPDILSAGEISRMINATRPARYQTFILSAYSMGLRLGETLNLTIADIDGRSLTGFHLQKKTKGRQTVCLRCCARLVTHRYASHLRNPTSQPIFGCDNPNDNPNDNPKMFPRKHPQP